MAELTMAYIIETLRKAEDKGATEVFEISGQFAGRLAAVLEEHQSKLQELDNRLAFAADGLAVVERRRDELKAERDSALLKLDAETKRADGNYAWGQSLLEEIKGYESRLSKCQKQLDGWEQAVKAGTPLGTLEGITELRFTLNGGEPSAVERPEPLCGIKGCDLPRNHDGWCNLGPLSE